MKNFKSEQIYVLLILSFLILVLHFFIMFLGNFPGGQYGMVPFILIIGLPIYIIILIFVLFVLNFFRINLSPQKVAILYTFIFLLFFSIDEGLSDDGMVQLFVYPSIISLIGYLAVNYLISEKD